MLDDAEVFFSQTKQRGAEEFSIATDIIVGMGVKLVAVIVVPLLFCLVFTFEVDRFRIPVIFLARHVTATFEN